MGIDLAWGANGRTGLAVVDDEGRLVASASVRTDAEIDAWLAAQPRPAVVAIDVPLAGPTSPGAVLSTNPSRVLRLAERQGWSIDPGSIGSEYAPVGIQVHPDAGMVGLFGLGRVLPYKKGAFADRRAAFRRLLELLESVPELALASSPVWARVRERFAAAARLADLDLIEDEVDAVFCAHLGWLWTARPAALQVSGAAAADSIIAPPPPPPTHRPTPRGSAGAVPTLAPATVEASTAGVGPWPGGRDAWPADTRFDVDLLQNGDTRNVIDRYRYWSMAAIVADLDTRRHPFSVAIENWQHDLNIGSIVRTANAFAAETVHIIGRRRWNRRGAMVTDRYQHVLHHPEVAGFTAWAKEAGLQVIAVDNVAGSVPVEFYPLPERCVLLFGQEGPGLSAEALAAAVAVVEIPQYGSTRSINASAAAAIVMHEWVRRWARRPDTSSG